MRSIIVQREPEVKKTLSVKISQETHNAVVGLKQRLKKTPNVESNFDDELELAIKKLVKQANAELDNLETA